MIEQYDRKAQTGGLNYIGYLVNTGGIDKSLSTSAIDALIDKDHESVDANIEKMRQQLGNEAIDKMSPGEFYKTYKRVAAGGY